MFEKVNPSHPDKVADRIAGALVDLAYQREENPRVAVEVLIGHGHAYIIAESSVNFVDEDVWPILDRICGGCTIHTLRLLCVPQDSHLAENQKDGLRCGDNGIFKGVPTKGDETLMRLIVRRIYEQFPTDGKFIIDDATIIACQSGIDREKDKQKIIASIDRYMSGYDLELNPLGDWMGGLDVDSGATNRKLGSDMGCAVTGGGLHGKDLSKADVSVNIVCHLLAQQLDTEVTASCAIGDKNITFCIYDDGESKYLNLTYAIVVAMAREFIDEIGGFEKFAEWGLV